MPTAQYQPVCSQCCQPSSKVGDKAKGLPRSHIEPYIAQSNAYIIHVTIYMHSSIISLLSPLLAHSYTGSYHYGYLGNLYNNNCSISSFSSHQVFYLWLLWWCTCYVMVSFCVVSLCSTTCFSCTVSKCRCMYKWPFVTMATIIHLLILLYSEVCCG